LRHEPRAVQKKSAEARGVDVGVAAKYAVSPLQFANLVLLVVLLHLLDFPVGC